MPLSCVHLLPYSRPDHRSATAMSQVIHRPPTSFVIARHSSVLMHLLPTTTAVLEFVTTIQSQYAVELTRQFGVDASLQNYLPPATTKTHIQLCYSSTALAIPAIVL